MISSLTLWLWLPYLISTYLCFSNFFLLLIYNFTLLNQESIYCMISILLNWECVLQDNMCASEERVFCYWLFFYISASTVFYVGHGTKGLLTTKSWSFFSLFIYWLNLSFLYPLPNESGTHMRPISKIQFISMHFFQEPVYITIIPFESLINLQSGCMQIICDMIFLWLARLTPPL